VYTSYSRNKLTLRRKSEVCL